MAWVLLIGFLLVLAVAVLYLWVSGRLMLDKDAIIATFILLAAVAFLIWHFMSTKVLPPPPAAPAEKTTVMTDPPPSLPEEPQEETSPPAPEVEAEEETEPLPEDVTPVPPETLIEDATVYFTLDSTMLVCETREQLEIVADFVEDHEVVAIQLIGHTDTAGEDERNETLSYKRAEAVRRHLVFIHDIPALYFDPIIASGERVPAVNTADGVRELLNRRVEITVEYIPTDNMAQPLTSVWKPSGSPNCPDSLTLPPLKPCPNC